MPSYNPLTNVAKSVYGHLKSHVKWNVLQDQRTLLGHINDDVQESFADMVQNWIRKVNPNFSWTSHGDQLGESCTQCNVLCQSKAI